MLENHIPYLIKAVEEASVAILDVYHSNFEVEIKADNSPVTKADKAASRIILEHLSPTGIPVISEEEEKMAFIDRQKEEEIWLVDPIDGTKEFIKKSGQFCISIALIRNGRPVLGLIASPTESKILFGGHSIGAYYLPYKTNNPLADKWKVKQKKTGINKVILHSNGGFSGSVVKFVRLLEIKYGKLDVIKKGSALKFIDLVLGEADFYVRLAPTMEWDIAAGQAIYEAVNGEVIHFETRAPLVYNKPQLKNPYFIAKRKHLII